ncbi:MULTISPECIES: flavin reductase family protein [unclassified Micromonospora]|uniref:flavin reductase family protein n=1 Tax=unclassified Micromonospora TaxID=2617518 RepID=UPI0011012CB1
MDGQPVSGESLRELFRQQACSVSVVTVLADPPVGFTATSLTSVSLSPPVVSFCSDLAGSCWSQLAQTDQVGVNLLREEQVDVARAFAARGIDRFSAARWHRGLSGVPLIDGALGWLECRVIERVIAGGQAIVLARPTRARVDGAGRPLLYHQGRYVALRDLPRQRVPQPETVDADA